MVRQQVSVPDSTSRDSTGERLLDATLVCIARVGFAKTTLDDVAREAGCARATLYRYFPGKMPLVQALVAREAASLGATLVRSTAGADTLADAAVAVLTTAMGELRNHDALRFVATVEPQVLLPFVTFGAADGFLRAGAQVVAPAFARFLPADDAYRLGEWLVRLGTSYLFSPSVGVDLTQEPHARELVESFVTPGFTRNQSLHTALAQGVVR